MDLLNKTTGTTKDVDRDGRTIVALVSRFGNRDAHGDIMQSGAFRESIRERGPGGQDRIWHLMDHDPTKRINKPDTVEETDEGLLFETVVPETRRGDDVLALYDAVGESMEHSVMIEILDSEPVDPQGEERGRYIQRTKLWEGSTVTWGANAEARLQDLKTDRELANDPAVKRHLDTMRELLDADLSDAFGQKVETTLHAIEAEVNNLLELQREEQYAEQACGGQAQEAQQRIASRLNGRLTIQRIQRKIEQL